MLFYQEQWRSPAVQDSRRRRSFPGGFDEAGVNIHIIDIFMIADSITFDKSQDWCCIRREEYRLKNGPFGESMLS